MIPLVLFRKLELGDVTLTSITLQLADYSIKKPFGILEDVLFTVDKFIKPIDFVILDFKADLNCPIILRIELAIRVGGS